MKLWPSLLLMAMPVAATFAADPPPTAGTALVTGSDRGIGFALVQEFESRGWQVIATSRNPATSDEITLPTRTPAEVAKALVLAIEGLKPEQNGKFLSITGKEVPW